jgi:hypothetical protein
LLGALHLPKQGFNFALLRLRPAGRQSQQKDRENPHAYLF